MGNVNKNNVSVSKETLESLVGSSADSAPSDGWKFTLNDLEPFDPLLSSLLILAKFYNRSTSKQALLSGLPLTENKLSPDLFKRAADRIGLSAKIVRINLRDIEAQQTPVVLLLKHSQACILTDVSSGVAKVIQPESRSGYNEIPLLNLEETYIGFCIFVKPTYQFNTEANKSNGIHDARNWFWRVMRKVIPFYGHVVAASFLINIFALATPLFIMSVYDKVVPTTAIPTLWVLAIGITIIFLFDFLIRNLRSYFIDSVGRGVDNELSRDTFEHLMGLKMANIPSSSGVLINSVHSFEFFRHFITSASISLLIDIPFAILFIVVMAILAGTVALVPIVIIPIILLVSFLSQASVRNLIDDSNKFSVEKHKVLTESLSGIETIKAVGAEGVMQKKWEVITKNLARLNARIRLLANVGVQSSNLINQLALVSVVIFGVYKIAAGDMTSGALIACVILVSRILSPVTKLALLFTRYRQSKHALAILDEVMKIPEERSDEKNFLHRSDLKGSIEFKDVVFRYPNQPIDVFRKISFSIKPREKVAIIGASGTGKTTIEKLLLKLYEVSSGSILIDGVEIKQLDPAELRHYIGYVSQDVVLFNGTIRENVAIVAPYVDDTVVLRAIKMSGLDSFVTKHPDGLDRMVYDRGRNLSGGQKQAVAIARALLLDPKILLFDEPCSFMDDKAVAAFVRNMQETLGDKTLILATHRYSLLEMVDRVIVIDPAGVILDGPKKEVLNKLKVAKAKVAANVMLADQEKTKNEERKMVS